MIFLGKQIGNWQEPFIVAEISGNHGGNFNSAINLINSAKEAGADAVKIQCYDADDLTLNDGYVIGGGTPWNRENLYELYKRAGTPKDWIEPMFKHAAEIGIPIFSSVYSIEGLALLEKLGCPAYKIASYEANDAAFIREVAKTNKPMVVSVGTLVDEEIDRAHMASSNDTVLLHCVSKYPTNLDELGLGTMETLMADFNDTPIGFSCHSDNPMAMAAAVAKGAAMIEVHLTLDDPMNSPDFEFSLLPDQLLWAIDSCKKLYRSNNQKTYTVEKAAREFKRSLYVVKDVMKGEVFTSDSVKSYRPAQGCSPHLLPNIIGRKAKYDIKANTPMQMEYVE